jgi:ATP-dependent protease ClpP protease subunit
MKRAEFKCQDRQAEVWIYDVIGKDFWGEGVSAKAFAEDLEALRDVDSLTVRINSPGGDVFDGNTIYNALHRFPAEVVVAVDGVAASAAALVAMAGDTVEMAENAMMMIHEASGGVYGRAAEHRHIADVLDKVNENQITAFATKAEASREKVAAWLEEETWFTAAEAVEAGLADEVTGALELAACIPPGIYQKTPKVLELSAKARKEPEPPPYRRSAAETLLTLIGP